MDRHSGQWIKNAKDDLQKLKAGWPSASICGYLYFPFTYTYKYVCECTRPHICAPLSLLCLCICHNGPTFGQVEAFPEEDLKGEGQQLFDGQRKVFTCAVIHFPRELRKLLEFVFRFISINIS